MTSQLQKTYRLYQLPLSLPQPLELLNLQGGPGLDIPLVFGNEPVKVFFLFPQGLGLAGDETG